MRSTSIVDFVRKLKATPQNLEVLSDGNQHKPYLHVRELIDAMLFIRNHAKDALNYFNIGAEDESVTVRFIGEEAASKVSPGARFTYDKGSKRWTGDVPRFVYSLYKLHALGRRPRLGSAGAVRLAEREIVAQEVAR